MKKYTLVIILIASLCTVSLLALSYSKKGLNPKAPTSWLSDQFRPLKGDSSLLAAIDSHVVCLHNESCLPLNDLTKQTLFISIGGNSDAWGKGVQLFTDGKFINIYTEEGLNALDTLATAFDGKKPSSFERLVVSLHANEADSLTIRPWVWKGLSKLPMAKERVLVTFGTFPAEVTTKLKGFNGVICAPENHPLMQDRVAQKLFGAVSIQGRLSNKLGRYKQFHGQHIAANGRLSFSTPEGLGIKSSDFNKIDAIANQGISAGAYPGCQIVVAVKGTIIYRKSFGNFTYEATSNKVSNEDVYDIASVTKIASSTLIAMHLAYQKKLDLDQNLGHYIPELTGSTAYKSIVIREMMTHQAGLEPFIPFYKRTLTDGNPTKPWYSEELSNSFGLEVAERLYLQTAYRDSMYARILRNPLKEKKYVYSDLCYYFMQPIFEKITGERQDQYVRNHIYNLMGLRNINYKPLQHYSKEHIVPTENDQYFRKQLLWGHVHDPGAAMLGGVGGHAGIFSNATDLASVMQLFLNKGRYAGHQFFDEAVVNEFTKAQFSGNKRGVGFDRPSANGGGTCDELASQQSFGHSGFTGTLAWADPKNEVVFVFLSNRVHPSQDNWKLRDMGIRTSIQHVVYQIVNARFGK